jgi:hypothetical protein
MSSKDTFEFNPEAPGDYAQQYAQWRLCRDTWGMYDITTYPGSRDEQVTGIADQPQVVTKRSMARFRR